MPNAHDLLDWYVQKAPLIEQALERLNNIETLVLPFLGAAGAPIAAGITVAEDVVEGADEIAAKVDALLGPGTAAKLQQSAPAPAPKPAPAANGNKPTPAQIIAKLAAAAVKG